MCDVILITYFRWRNWWRHIWYS